MVTTNAHSNIGEILDCTGETGNTHTVIVKKSELVNCWMNMCQNLYHWFVPFTFGEVAQLNNSRKQYFNTPILLH